jgi:hypothetical protein
MKRITLLGTDHEETGKCNIAELYNLLLEIKPDMLFNEIPVGIFSAIMDEHKFYDTVEVSAVRKYLEKYPVRHIPVDMVKLDNTVLDYEDKISNTNINQFYDRIKKMYRENGFPWINTKEHDALLTEWHKQHRGYFTHTEPSLFDEYQRSYTYHFVTREETILNNIHNCAEDYTNGILLIGGYHRPTLISKIKELTNTKKTDIAWEYYYKEQS